MKCCSKEWYDWKWKIFDTIKELLSLTHIKIWNKGFEAWGDNTIDIIY